MKQARISILAGQSNAVGVGHAAYLPEHFSAEKVKEYYDGYENIKINYFSHDKKSNGFVKTTVGCTERTKHTIGPELGIAEYLTETHPNEEFFIVKCAFGGMSLHRDFRSPSSGAPYDKKACAEDPEHMVEQIFSGMPVRAGWAFNELVKLTHESIADLETRRYTPRIIGFCWMQGENDSKSPEHTAHYSEHYHNLLTDFSAVFAPYMENCIFADGGISQRWENHLAMNEVKRAYAQSHENCRYIDTIAAGLTFQNEPEEEPDTAHYDSDSVIKLGRLFAEAIL